MIGSSFILNTAKGKKNFVLHLIIFIEHFELFENHSYELE